MAVKPRKKRGPQRIFKSGNFFPDLSLGLQKNYIYYNSLLVGDDERFAGNRRIGEQVQNYLMDTVGGRYLNPDIDNSMDVVLPALNLILRAAENERKKEVAWVAQVCEALGMNAPSNSDDFDYMEFIKIVNEVQKGSSSALAAIAAEKERWSRIDIEAVLEAKKQQRQYEAKARNLERNGKKKDKEGMTIDEIREAGAKQYYETIRRMAGEEAKKNDLTPLNSKLEHIRASCHKIFTSPRSNFTTDAVTKLMPIALKAMKIQGKKLDFNVDLLDKTLQGLIMMIVEEIVTDELTADLTIEKGSQTKFLQKGAIAQGKELSSKINELLSSEVGLARLEAMAETVYRENASIQQLDQLYQSDEYEDLLAAYKNNNNQTHRITQQLLKRLREQKSIQEEYYKDTGKRWKSGQKKGTELFDQWLTKKYNLDSDYSIASIIETARNSVSGNWYYSEIQPIQDGIKRMVELGNKALQGSTFRPSDFPKTDVLAGYLTCEISYDEKPLRQKQLTLQKHIHQMEKAQSRMDKALQDFFDETNNSKTNLTKTIRKHSDVDDYTHNAEAFLELREKQLAILDQLTQEILQQQKDLDIALTRFNVLTTVKDQEGILAPRRGQAIGAKGKNYMEAGIGFSGGAMGKNDSGLSVIDNLIALGKQGGNVLTDEDGTWLKFALLNSGLGLLGFKNRATLENYFSLFASFLMFDDAQNIVADALIQRADEIGKTNTVQEIHLYIFNGIYFPQSYILTELYNHMREAISSASFKKRNLSKGTVRTQIYGYNVGSKYPGNTEADWEREADNARKTTKIKMYFLMNMADVVNQLYEKALPQF